MLSLSSLNAISPDAPGRFTTTESLVPGSPRNISLTLSTLSPSVFLPSIEIMASPALKPALYAGIFSYGPVMTVVFSSL